MAGGKLERYSRRKSKKPWRINMLSKAHWIKGQGVASAYEEQVRLVMDNLNSDFIVMESGRMKSDITHIHTVNPSFYLLTFSRRETGVRVGHVHMVPETVEHSLHIPWIFKQFFYKYLIFFYKRMDRLVTVNPYFIGVLEKYGVKRENISYIPNYVSGDVFHQFSEPRRRELRQKWGIPSDAFVVLGVGQTQVRKGIFDFIETAKNLPEHTFLWVGGFSFGKMTDGYEKVKEIMAHPPENVRFLGIVDREEMPEIFNLGDVLFLPSFEELFPMTVLEAMACRIPLLLRDLEIYGDILFDYYLREESVDGFSTILDRLKRDPDFYEKACRASESGHVFYSKEHVFSMWDSFYRSLLSENKGEENEFVEETGKRKN